MICELRCWQGPKQDGAGRGAGEACGSEGDGEQEGIPQFPVEQVVTSTQEWLRWLKGVSRRWPPVRSLLDAGHLIHQSLFFVCSQFHAVAKIPQQLSAAALLFLIPPPSTLSAVKLEDHFFTFRKDCPPERSCPPHTLNHKSRR